MIKKKYVKPQITFESFQLSTSIAFSCTLLGTNSAQFVCPVEDPELGWTYFADGVASACDTAPVNGNICYDIPVANWNVTNS